MTLNYFKTQGADMKPWIMWVTIAAVFVLVVFPYADWGSVMLRSPQMITVTASAQREQSNEIAQFYAGVTITNADKQAAVDEANTKMAEVITNLKEFGIPDEDIKTQGANVYQDQEQVTTEGRQRFEPGMWRVTNSIQIKLKDGSRTSDLLSVLGSSGLTDISGPNFMLDPDTQNDTTDLLQQAVQKAREKADKVAQSNGMRVRRVVNISEGGAMGGGMPMMDMAMSARSTAAPIEAGTSTVYSSVTVTFEMR
jgi:uncharacterized protein YggE